MGRTRQVMRVALVALLVLCPWGCIGTGEQDSAVVTMLDEHKSDNFLRDLGTDLNGEMPHQSHDLMESDDRSAQEAHSEAKKRAKAARDSLDKAVKSITGIGLAAPGPAKGVSGKVSTSSLQKASDSVAAKGSTHASHKKDMQKIAKAKKKKLMRAAVEAKKAVGKWKLRTKEVQRKANEKEHKETKRLKVARAKAKADVKKAKAKEKKIVKLAKAHERKSKKRVNDAKIATAKTRTV